MSTSSNVRGADGGEQATPKPPLPPLPHELTAEWTVRAQLTFARAGEPVQREFNAQEPLQPMRVVYKWSTPHTEAEHEAEPEPEKVSSLMEINLSIHD